MTHPSMMTSFFAPPMPFHPEELHKHVKELDGIYNLIPGSNANQKTALAKAIISATASFVEGCLDSMFRLTLGELAIPQPLDEALLVDSEGFKTRSSSLRDALHR